MNIRAQALTDVGRKRPHNEDAFFCDPAQGLYVVCDGMGGHLAGEVASQMCIDAVRDAMARERPTLEKLISEPGPQARDGACRVVERAIQEASRKIFEAAEKSDGEEGGEGRKGMGTTAVLLATVGQKAIIGHVGDSRVYLVRGGQVHRLTEDHTLVQAQINAGMLTPEQAAASSVRNVITRAVGIQESVQVDTLVLDMLPGDHFLLCSDGLHGYLKSDEIPKLLGETDDLPGVCKRFVDLANGRGGKDNITVLLVAAEAAPARVSGTARTVIEIEPSDAEARLRAISAMPLFRHMTYKEQMSILAAGHAAAFDAGQEIVVEGTVGEDMFVVVHGKVGVENGGVQVAELPAGGHFGEMSLVDAAPRSATVRALVPTRCMVIRRSELMALMRREPVLAVKLLWSFVQVLSDRLRATDARLSQARQERAAPETRPFAQG